MLIPRESRYPGRCTGTIRTGHRTRYTRRTLPVLALLIVPGALIAAGATENDVEEPQLNRLAEEKSPYLLQHADNPVDWYPWGEEAFEKARETGKPIFLSIGYSTCHWCHVMARESFADPETGALMNEHFVNIKVDREERPDIDTVYMTYVQATTGTGGWPLSVWLTPDLKPFIGGTYFPPEDTRERPGFRTVLRRVATAWERDADAIRNQADRVLEQLREATRPAPAGDAELPDRALIESALRAFAEAYDSEHGGFGTPPKFPRPAAHQLLHATARQPAFDAELRERAAEMSLETLRKMANSGIHDRVGGGFHRYAVDREWLVPHFEKMLYDQGQLAVLYLNAYRMTGNSFFADVARNILEYVSRDLSHPEGGFYSAEDAESYPTPDSQIRIEGAFYTWTEEEISDLLDEDAAVVRYVYGINSAGNIPSEHDPRDQFRGANVLHMHHSIADAAERFNLPEEQVRVRLADAAAVLHGYRTKERPRPHLDDKILTEWNGLMISAYAIAYQLLGDADYRERATRAARFIRERLYDAETGELRRSYREGPADIRGFASDYAMLIQGLIDLYEADFDTEWLAWAKRLQERQNNRFQDAEEGGFFATARDHDRVLLRMKKDYDNAIPSENSVAARNLQRLASMLDRPEWRVMADATIRSVASNLARQPDAMPQMLVALDAAQTKPAQVVIAGEIDASDTRALLDIARRHARPHQIVLLADGGEGQRFLAGHAEFITAVRRIDDKATAYVCEDFVCQLPTTDPEEVRTLLRAGTRSDDGSVR